MNKPKQDIAKVEPSAGAESAAMLQVIERAASDPNVDIEKMERLLAMQKDIFAMRAKQAYLVALSEMQPELPVIEEHGKIRNKTGGVQSKYALWEDINEAFKPILTAHGFTLSFRTSGTTTETVEVTGILSHREGHEETTVITLPTDQTGSKNAVQALGSSVSYGKRYTAGALLNITSRGEDDDGKAAGAPKFITDAQADELMALCEEVGADKIKFCKFFEIESFAEIVATDFDKAKDMIWRKAEAESKKDTEQRDQDDRDAGLE